MGPILLEINARSNSMQEIILGALWSGNSR